MTFSLVSMPKPSTGAHAASTLDNESSNNITINQQQTELPLHVFVAVRSSESTTMPFYSDTNAKQNRSYDEDDNDIDDDNEVLDSDGEYDDERMSFLQQQPTPMKDGSSSSRSSRNGGSGSSSRSKKRMYVLLVASGFVAMVLIGRWSGLIQFDDAFTSTTTTSDNNATHAHSKTNNVVSKSTTTATVLTPPPPPLLFPPPKRNDELLPGYKKPRSEVSDRYMKRGRTTLTAEQRNEITNQYGYWNVSHPPNPPASSHSLYSFYANYSHQDVPRTEFPPGAWQTNTTYLAEFLPTAIQYVEHCLEAMLAEYGHSKYDTAGPSLWERAYMFDISIQYTEKDKYNLKHPPGNAGFATDATIKALQKRLLHSIMTENSFTVVMGGHSAAAGHGNHFQQSYTLQIQRIIEPILARLGVTHKSHNFGMGGLGTIQNALGMSDMYGTDTDVLIWDSGMTEGDGPSKDLFARMGILSGKNKVPILWGRPDDGRYESVAPGAGSILTGFYGMSMAGIPETQSAIQVKTIPYAAQYLKCSSEANNDICKNSRYQSKCWIQQPAGNNTIQPMTKQNPQPGGQAKWHPGNRYHQIQGRAIAFQIVHQLYNALTQWYNTPDYDIPDSAWHLTKDFQRIQEAVRNTKNTPCYEFFLPDKVCEVPLQSRSEFTPRYNPSRSSIRSIVKQGVSLQKPPKNMYDPELEPHLDVLDPPISSVDVLSIVENGIDFVPNRIRTEILAGYHAPVRHRHERQQRNLVSAPPLSYENYEPIRKPITSGLEPGQGWYLKTKSAPDNCDGSYDSFCGRSWDSDCLLSGHNDMRGGLGFDSYSGWMIMNLENVVHGIIMIRVEDWWGANDNGRTKNWSCENMNIHQNCTTVNRRHLLDHQNEKVDHDISLHSQSTQQRTLGDSCENFHFEFAIDGIVTKWDQTEWDKNRRQIQRVVPIWVLSNGSAFNVTGDTTGRDVELAIRVKDCKRAKTFGLSHVYWA